MSNPNFSNALKAVAERLITRAWEDTAFKQQLQDNPHTAIEQATGLKLPSSLQIKVVQETKDTVYLVLPVTPAQAEEDELSDTELETVAGGGRGVPTSTGYPNPSCP